MISQLAGAIVRAVFVVVLIATPSLLLPGVGADTTQIVALVAIFAAMLTIFEYGSTYPGLIEFRDAPPFNRVRFISLFLTVFLLTVVCRGRIEPTTLTLLVDAVGNVIGHAIDFPYSPVRLVLVALPEGSSVEQVNLLRTAAGLSYLISLLTLAIFVILLRVFNWPSGSGTFNVWINLPTFDPTAGGDVVERLERDARFNIALGFLLPFLTPAVVKAGSGLFAPLSLDAPHTLIWMMAAWAFLPASLFMRGIAMGQVASMIEEKRRLNLEAADRAGLLPA